MFFFSVTSAECGGVREDWGENVEGVLWIGFRKGLFGFGLEVGFDGEDAEAGGFYV